MRELSRRQDVWRALLLSVAFLAGCKPSNKGGERSSDSAMRVPSRGQEVADTSKLASAVVGPHMTYLGQLPYPLDNYDGKDSAQIFYDRLKGAGWLGWRASRKCKEAACNGNAAGEMIIQAITDAHQIPIALDKSVAGVVVARLINTGKYQDKTFPIPAGTPGNPDHYYVVLERMNASSARLRVARVQFASPGKAELVEVLKGEGLYKSCGHPHVDRKRGYAAFSNCVDGPPPPLGAYNASMKLVQLTDYTVDGVWISCPEGCCSGGWPVIPG